MAGDGANTDRAEALAGDGARQLARSSQEPYRVYAHPDDSLRHCRSAEGETVGLIDAAIHVLRAASRCDLSAEPVREALADLWADAEVQQLLREAEREGASP